MVQPTGLVPFASLQETARGRKPDTTGFLKFLRNFPLYSSPEHFQNFAS